MADVILYGQKGGKKPIIPIFDGKCRITPLKSDWSAGYVEFFTSGALKWAYDPPKSVDLFCVGGGGGGLNGDQGYNSSGGDATGYPGTGGGSGYTTTTLSQRLEAETEVIIGAGGSAGASGGVTSIGSLCSANGGETGGTAVYSAYGRGGKGGSGGGGYGSQGATVGGSNGSNSGSCSYKPYGGTEIDLTGIGQGTPTTDLLGRIHAGGGAAGQSWKEADIYGRTGVSVAGGASDFAEGKGANGSFIVTVSGADVTSGASGYGGGGFGGGGGGGGSRSSWTNTSYSGGAGGQGFAMLAWGDYKNILGLS